jgi:hypothetical protein
MVLFCNCVGVVMMCRLRRWTFYEGSIVGPFIFPVSSLALAFLAGHQRYERTLVAMSLPFSNPADVGRGGGIVLPAGMGSEKNRLLYVCDWLASY